MSAGALASLMSRTPICMPRIDAFASTASRAMVCCSSAALWVRLTLALPIIWLAIMAPTSSTANMDASASLVPIRKSWMRVIVVFPGKSNRKRAQKIVKAAHKAALHYQGTIRLRFHVSLNGC